MKVIRKELPRDQKNCYAVTAWMSVEEVDKFTLKEKRKIVKREYEETATEEADTAMDAILIMIGIDYAAEKELKVVNEIVDESGYFKVMKSIESNHSAGGYFIDHYGDLFKVYIPYMDGNYQYSNYMTIKYEYGQEAYEIVLDKNDPFVGKVRSICDRIMEEFESLGEDDDYFNGDFMEGYWLYVDELRKEKIEWKSEV